MQYSETLFKKNLDLLLRLRPNLSEVDYSVNEARDKRDRCNYQNDLDAFFSDSDKCFQLPWLLPRSSDDAENLTIDYSKFEIPGQINQYLDIPDRDPHLVKYLLKLRNSLIDLGIDPQDTITVPSFVTNFLCCGTGDGLFIRDFIEKFEPKNLIIAVSTWTDWLSSCWLIDWEDHTQIAENNARTVSLLRAKSKDDIAAHIASKGLLSSEHCLIYKPDVSSSEILEYTNDLYSDTFKNTIQYLGFQLDEYNMLVNSSRTFKQNPKIYQSSLASLDLQNVIVTGSGPSLDKSIDGIKKLSPTHIIVASGSSYHALRKAGIEVDYLVLVERANNTYDDYLSTVRQYGPGETILVMSSTCPAELCDLFRETIIFFRPALTPLSIYSDSAREVLNFEGPESVNGGFAWACALKPKSIVMIGTDLGTTNKDILRSANANGVSPRVFDLEVRGNLSKIAYTSKMLLDSQHVISSCISFFDQHVINCSDGIYIEKTSSMSISEYLTIFNDDVLEGFVKYPSSYMFWLNSLPLYDDNRHNAFFVARNPRESVQRTCSQLRNIFTLSKDWPHSKVLEIDSVLSIHQNIRNQFCPRVIRSTFYKLFLVVIQQDLVNAKGPEKLRNDFLLRASSILLEALDDIEVELFQLCDLLTP